MNRKQKEAASMAWLAIAGIYIGSAVFDAVKTTIQERKKRSEIQARSEAELKRIRYAKNVIMAKLENGGYDKTGYAKALEDFRFVTDVMSDIDEQ